MKKMRIGSMLLTAAMVVSMSGCSSKTGDVNSKIPETEANGKEITIWTRGSENDVHGASFIESLEKFEEETGIRVNYQFVAHNDVVTKWNSAFASGTAPDVIDLGILHLVERVNLNQIIPLDDYVAQWEGKNDIYPSILDLGTLNDHTYAIGHYPDPNIFVYRKDMFKEVGLNPEQPPKDWDEMLADAQLLTKKDDSGNVERGGFAVPTQGARFLANILVRQNGGSFADEVNGVPNMTNQEGVEAFQYMAELQKCSTIFDGSKNDTNPLILDQAAMGYIPNGLFSTYINNNPDKADKFGVAACVPGKEEAAWCGVWFYGITSQAKDTDNAWKLIEYLTSKDVLSRRIQAAGTPTTFASTAEEFIALNPDVNQGIIDAVEAGTGNPRVSWASLYEKALDNAAEEVFYGVKTVEEALQGAQEYLTQEIE